ncbi:DUF2272 domain-containing protein [Xylophilus sp. GW821-FHT01B05]
MLSLAACAPVEVVHTPAAPQCSATAQSVPTDPRVVTLVAEARRQQQLFGGQTIDVEGHLVRSGFYEAEADRAPGESTLTWQRVLGFWRSLDPDKPREVRGPDGRFVSIAALLDRLPAEGEQRAALTASVQRAALIDNPWSAAFISYLEKTAGLSEAEFAFSDAHHVYVAQAFRVTEAERAGAQADGGAYRACDIASTTPRAGDLICHTRGAGAGLDRFQALGAVLAAQRALPMHCDLVVAVDRESGLLQSIGGNVLQSVTLRQMALDAGPAPTLSRRYFTWQADADDAACAEDGACATQGNFNRQPWSVLLQWRR